mmetsp:Transcript_8522/g.33522  ORF Transcript_8522/g.33522 Transcript_8522/m.33522 type:complete len:213 (-) Transcript_8522:1569-2207(-)
MLRRRWEAVRRSGSGLRVWRPRRDRFRRPGRPHVPPPTFDGCESATKFLNLVRDEFGGSSCRRRRGYRRRAGSLGVRRRRRGVLVRGRGVDPALHKVPLDLLYATLEVLDFSLDGVHGGGVQRRPVDDDTLRLLLLGPAPARRHGRPRSRAFALLEGVDPSLELFPRGESRLKLSSLSDPGLRLLLAGHGGVQQHDLHIHEPLAQSLEIERF